MIVVAGRTGAPEAIEVARRIAAAAGRPELVAPVPPGPTGDRLLLSLATAGVGHAAMPRSVAPELDAADLELALRYLPDVRVIVLIGTTALARTAADAAAWLGAALVVVAGEAEEAPDLGPADAALVVSGPSRDPDGAFAGLVADLAVRLDAGEAPASAWSATLLALAVEPVSLGIDAPDPGAPAVPARSAAPGPARPGSGRRSGRR